VRFALLQVEHIAPLCKFFTCPTLSDSNSLARYAVLMPQREQAQITGTIGQNFLNAGSPSYPESVPP
jgi:hypothetical protein